MVTYPGHGTNQVLWNTFCPSYSHLAFKALCDLIAPSLLSLVSPCSVKASSVHGKQGPPCIWGCPPSSRSARLSTLHYPEFLYCFWPMSSVTPNTNLSLQLKPFGTEGERTLHHSMHAYIAKAYGFTDVRCWRAPGGQNSNVYSHAPPITSHSVQYILVASQTYADG